MTSRSESSDAQTVVPSDASDRRLHDNELDFYTIGQIADLLDVTGRTVWRWIKARKLIAHRFGRVVRVARRDLLAFLALHRED
jgi:excisionase family DNA binding protein